MLNSEFRRLAVLRIATRLAVSAAIGFVIVSSSAAQTLQPLHPASVTIQELRRHMFDAEVNTLTFRNMETIMDTRKVANAAPVWTIPRDDRPLDFTYVHAGVTRSAEEALQRTFTNALLIIKDGRIVHERYLNNADETSRFVSWSMSKSITSMLIGIAVTEGKIASVDDRIAKYIPELKETGYGGVTLRQALQMRSGVDFEERYDFENASPAQEAFETALVTNTRRYADPARGVKRAKAPGSTFEYRTLDTAVLGWVLERAVGQSISDYTSAKLWRPLGAESHGAWLMDGPPSEGREFNGAGFVARLRDYGRLGLLMLNQGATPHQRILSADWIRESTAPTNPQPEPDGSPLGYGYQWWTVSGTHAYVALGLQGQYLFVDPESRTVVVKLSYFPPDAQAPGEETLSFMKAVTRWQPLD